MERKYDKKLVLGDGTVFEGYGFGADREAVCELVSVSYTHLTLPTKRIV